MNDSTSGATGTVPDAGADLGSVAAPENLEQAPAATGSKDAAPTSWTAPGAGERLRILRRTKTVAILGASNKPSRASYFVETYLLADSDFELWFVNPNETEILGRPSYPSLRELPGVPDLVDVFRRPSELGAVLDDVIAVGSPVMWMQLGLADDAVARRGAEHGVTVVMNRCLKIEHARFHGGLHLAGFDTGVISARRRAR
ncbi:CoA-binding protein [Kineococcus sp. GCM10028916]|uniref:CoA-binding protein n=1 Tax=Kineococcus sp. GCM10028916 TaxID=3273394 RepID=UPI0036406A9C